MLDIVPRHVSHHNILGGWRRHVVASKANSAHGTACEDPVKPLPAKGSKLLLDRESARGCSRPMNPRLTAVGSWFYRSGFQPSHLSRSPFPGAYALPLCGIYDEAGMDRAFSAFEFGSLLPLRQDVKGRRPALYQPRAKPEDYRPEKDPRAESPPYSPLHIRAERRKA